MNDAALPSSSCAKTLLSQSKKKLDRNHVSHITTRETEPLYNRLLHDGESNELNDTKKSSPTLAPLEGGRT